MHSPLALPAGYHCHISQGTALSMAQPNNLNALAAALGCKTSTFLLHFYLALKNQRSSPSAGYRTHSVSEQMHVAPDLSARAEMLKIKYNQDASVMNIMEKLDLEQ